MRGIKAKRISARGFAFVSAFACQIALMLLTACCGGKPFNVKARPEPPPAVAGAVTESQGVSIQAEAVTDEDYLYEVFDANLIMAGILPVRLKIENRSGEALNLKRVKFEVVSSGRPLKRLDASGAFKRLISFYGISTYSKEGYRESRGDLSSYALLVDAPLAQGETRQGLLFFRVPDDQIRQSGLTLLVKKLKPGRSDAETPVELRLN
ncbi:MAG TPA: hypothetical protein VNH22_21230 [Blastocatellia bacterium]|jgi:hypothetical protein|nr:hypothetical protein [Blastocatellia bacterium]